jgi:hypothetical protein
MASVQKGLTLYPLFLVMDLLKFLMNMCFINRLRIQATENKDVECMLVILGDVSLLTLYIFKNKQYFISFKKLNKGYLKPMTMKTPHQ